MCHPLQRFLLSFPLLLAIQPLFGAAADAGPTPAMPYSPPELPGHGLAQHPFFYAGEWYYTHPEQKMVIVRDGRGLCGRIPSP